MRTRPSTRRSCMRARKRCARRCPPTLPRRNRSAYCPCGTSTRSARTWAAGLTRPTHALGPVIQAQQRGVPFLSPERTTRPRDGSGIRDYIHVRDMAEAHVAALGRFDALPGPAIAINLGPARAPQYENSPTHSTAWPIARSRCARPGGGRVTWSAPATRIGRAERLLGWRARATCVRCSWDEDPEDEEIRHRRSGCRSNC